jgi:predicted O-methyltransferase YrrM
MAEMTPLCELGEKYKTDKYKPHHYTRIYHRLLAARRSEVRRVLEIGIRTGASLRMWEEFFPYARIYGMDKNPDFLKLNAGRITSHWGNQNKPEKMAQIAKALGGNFDVIIDDGSHHPDNQIRAMGATLQFLKPDGFYFIEDVRGDGDVTRIQSHIPKSFANHLHRSNKTHPQYGFEKMLVLWNPLHVTPQLTEG